MAPFRRNSSYDPKLSDRWDRLPTPAMTGAPDPLRSVWTERDFPTLGWHDATLWAFDIQYSATADHEPNHRVRLDLDYITQWVGPEPGQRHYTFWVAPCTLVFSGVIEFELEAGASPQLGGPRSIADIHLVKGGWHVEGHDGFDLKMAATSFRQNLCAAPTRHTLQSLSLDERGGYSFDETPIQL